MPDYASALNSAQYEAVTSSPGHTLVVAGAGSGKTRVIVYRLAWLAEQGIAPESILLLTFTRKAAQEMLNRAEELIGHGLRSLPGGTFHSFAFNTLRIYKPAWLEGRSFTLMDASDITQTIKECKQRLNTGKKDSSFPKTQTIAGLLSKARNKEMPLSEILRQESFHLMPHAEALEDISAAYATLKRERGSLDYDDLLFELEDLLKNNAGAARAVRNRFSNILVDEYQDTNLVQARLAWLLAQPAHPGETGANVMAVGDEAQSIYAFRGANVRNIMDFPKLFPDTRIIRLEQNYRSTQPILDVANGILANAAESFKKNLFTEKKGGDKPTLARPLSDASEAELICNRIEELLLNHLPHEIAVLFRAGFHSYALENALRKRGIAFRKYGGLRFVEAAHVKDLLAFARLAINPLDYAAFGRIAVMHRGIGSKTMASLHKALLGNDQKALQKAFKRFPTFLEDLELVENLRAKNLAPQQFLEEVLERYRPRLEELYPDDWPSRVQGLEEILHMAQAYNDLDLFVADLALDSPDNDEGSNAEDYITLSTVHSAKGLEWNVVMILDAVEDRFPSRHALVKPEDFEEERRLFYVACTRARQLLEIYAPTAIYSHNGSGMTAESPFLRELKPDLFSTAIEKYSGGLSSPQPGAPPRKMRRNLTPPSENIDVARSGLFAADGKPLKQASYCRHRIFGRGKILQHLEGDRAQVNFPGFGVKIILADYLAPED